MRPRLKPDPRRTRHHPRNDGTAATSSAGGTSTTAEAGDLDGAALTRWESDLEGLATEIGRRYFPGNADALRPEKLTGLA